MKKSVVRRGIFPAVILIIAGAAAAESAPRVEVLRPAEVKSECGCSFQFASTKSKHSDTTFLQWDVEDNGTIRIDGKLIRLKASHVRSEMKGSIASIGDKDTFRLRGGHIDVVVDCTAVQVCAAQDDSCESTEYEAKVTVKSPGGTSTLNATGACGC
jgi:hypothetical protein